MIFETSSKENVTLHLVTENGSVDSENVDYEFMLALKAGFAQLERKKIAERTKFGLDRKRQRGERISLNPPYGELFSEDVKVIENPEKICLTLLYYSFDLEIQNDT